MRTHSLPLVLGTILGASASMIIAILTLIKKNKKIFVGKTILYLLGTALMGAVLGASGYLLDNQAIPPDDLYILLEVTVIISGALHFSLLYRINPWSRREGFLSEFVFTLLVTVLAAISFVLLYQWIGVGHYAVIFVSVFCLFPLAFLVMKAYDFWLSIPRKSYRPWFLPIEKKPPVIEQTKEYLDLIFHIPITYHTTDMAEFDIRSPLDSSVGELFHYLIYRHNEQEKLTPQIPDIEIAEDNRRDKLYGWLFFTRKYHTKQYIDPKLDIKTVLHNTTDIFVERIKP